MHRARAEAAGWRHLLARTTFEPAICEPGAMKAALRAGTHTSQRSLAKLGTACAAAALKAHTRLPRPTMYSIFSDQIRRAKRCKKKRVETPEGA